MSEKLSPASDTFRLVERQAHLQTGAALIGLALPALGIAGDALAQAPDAVPNVPAQTYNIKAESENAVKVSIVKEVEDVLRLWTPQRRLFINGDVGLGIEQIERLQGVLAQYPHWTVYLVQNSKPEEFTDLTGEKYSGASAVKQAIGTGLPNQSGFGSLVDAKTGLANGCAFVISLNDKKLYFYGSEHQRAYGVEAENFAVENAQPAQEALRNGGRVADAVIDTIKSIEGKIENSQAVFAFIKEKYPYGLMLLAALGFTGTAIGMRRRRNASKQEADELIQTTELALTEKKDALELLKGKRDGILEPNGGAREFEDESARSALKIRAGVAMLDIMHGVAESALSDARTFAAPSGLSGVASALLVRNYAAAIGKLTEDPLSFNGQADLERIFRDRGRDQLEKLWRDMGSFEPLKMGFNDLMFDFSRMAIDANVELDKLDNACRTVQTRHNELGLSLEQFSKRLLAYDTTNSGSELDINVGASPVVAQCQELLRVAQAKAERNPIAADNALQKISILLERGNKLMGELEEAYKIFPQITASRESLAQNEISESWSRTRLSQTLARVVPWLSELSKNPDLQANLRVLEEVQSLAKDMQEACKLNDLRRGQLAGKIAATEEKLNSACSEISNRYGVPHSNVMREEKADPHVTLAQAKAEQDAIADRLRAGNIKAAQEMHSKANASLELSGKIIEASREAWRAFSARAAEVEKGTAAHRTATPRHEAILNGLKQRWAPSTMLLGSGDPEHPRANNTVADNIDEVNTALKEADSCLATARELQVEGKILLAKAHMERIDKIHQFINYRYAEISEKEARINRVNSANDAALVKHEGQLRELKRDGELFTTTRATISAIEDVESSYRLVAGDQQGESIDPFVIAARVEKLAKAIENSQRRVAEDREDQRSVAQGLDQVKLSLGKLSELIRSSEEELRVRNRELKRWLAVAFDAAKTYIQEAPVAHMNIARRAAIAHADWRSLRQEIAEMEIRIAEHATQVKDDFDTGKKVVKRLADATAQVEKARRWNSQCGVSMAEQYGQKELQDGHDSLARGDYKKALKAFGAAEKAACGALSSAESSLQRLRSDQESARLASQRQRSESDTSWVDIAGSVPMIDLPSWGDSASSAADVAGSTVDVLGSVAETAADVGSGVGEAVADVLSAIGEASW